MNHRRPWHVRQNYIDHHTILRVLHQDTKNTTIHKVAISNHDKLEVSKIKQIWSFQEKKGYKFNVLINKDTYTYYFMNKGNQEPLLTKKIYI